MNSNQQISIPRQQYLRLISFGVISHGQNLRLIQENRHLSKKVTEQTGLLEDMYSLNHKAKEILNDLTEELARKEQKQDQMEALCEAVITQHKKLRYEHQKLKAKAAE